MQWIKRVLERYSLPVCCLGIVSMILTVNPPLPITLATIILFGWPLLGIARSEGYRDGFAEATRRVQRASNLPTGAISGAGEG